MERVISGALLALLLGAGCDDDSAASDCDLDDSTCAPELDAALVFDGGAEAMDMESSGDVPFDAFVRPDGPPECMEEGLEEVRRCGVNNRGIERRVCAGQSFTDWSRCIDEDECRDGTVDVEECDDGERRRGCATGRWTEWSECGEPPECDPGALELQACGRNDGGRQQRECAGGRWSQWSECDDPDECDEGIDENRPCGIDANGTQPRTCLDGSWSQWGPCDDPDRDCEADVTERVPCGLNRRGRAAHTCEAGRWGPFDACDDPDECIDEADQQQECDEAGTFRTRVCEEGSWRGWGDCEGAL